MPGILLDLQGPKMRLGKFEGGQATLMVTPDKQSLLVDTGWPGFGDRDADQIQAAALRHRVIRDPECHWNQQPIEGIEGEPPEPETEAKPGSPQPFSQLFQLRLDLWSQTDRP